MLSKKDILAAPDIQRESVSVPEWGGEVWVYGMNGAERGEYTAAIMEIKGGTQIMHLARAQVLLCSLCMKDENGRRLFDADEVDALGKKSAQAIDQVASVAQRLSGIAGEDLEKIAKNLTSEGNADSGSASPVT